jgi:hypothetical protein
VISMTDQESATAAEAARILGVTRDRVLELAASAPDFPLAESTASGGRIWPRAAIEAWAAAHPDRGPRFTGLEVASIGGWPPQVERVASLAAAEARALHHDWAGQDHLLLALLHPDCPGAAPAVLASFGVTAQPLREAFVASMGDPYEAHHRGTAWSPAAQLVLERANLEAVALADDEVASEHVLLALTGRWEGASAPVGFSSAGSPRKRCANGWSTSPRGWRRLRLRRLPRLHRSLTRPLRSSWRPPPTARTPAGASHGAPRCSLIPTAGRSSRGSRCANTWSTGTAIRC